MTHETRQYVALPDPISHNSIYQNVPGKGRVRTKAYRAWAKVAKQMLAAQPRLHRHAKPVLITYYVGERDIGRMDAGNVEKAYTDALVSAGIIHDDSRHWLRGVAVLWVPDMRACVALIEPVETEIQSPDHLIQRVPAGLREVFR